LNFGVADLEILTVSQVTRYIKELLESDTQLGDLWLQGEVSNYTQSAAGHVYFTLKDPSSQIRCVMWRSRVPYQSQLPRDGDEIVAHGYVSVYEVQGNYQFYVDIIQPLGLGRLYLQFEALKQKLEAEGLFDPAHKRPLPVFPRGIGLVTSPTGAAIRDILRILQQRYPLAEIILAPTLVQGPDAPPQIVEAIQALNTWTDVEVILVARGGGSPEELWAFNDEAVARVLYASRVPIVTGIGHEIDFTIADFVADLRAPTPSAAAMAVVPDGAELQSRLTRERARLTALMQDRLAARREALLQERRALARLSPRAQLDRYRQRLDELAATALARLRHHLTVQRERLAARAAQLAALSPLATLTRGYAIVRERETGHIVKQVQQVRHGLALKIQVSDGEFGAEVV